MDSHSNNYEEREEISQACRRADFLPRQINDLQNIYPYLSTGQEIVVDMHANAALHLLLEQALTVFCATQKPVSAFENLPEKLITFLNDLKLYNPQNSLPTFLHSTELDPFWEIAVLNEIPSHNHIKIIQDAATKLLPLCHDAESIVSQGNRTTFNEGRAKTTKNADEYEDKVYEFTDKVEAAIKEVDTSTETGINTHKELLENLTLCQSFLRKFHLWRDGVLLNRPPIPPVEGFPPIDNKKIPKTLRKHPVALEVHAISERLCEFDFAKDLELDLQPIQIIESGQKGLPRIIEKVAAKPKNNDNPYLPSQLKDMMRASFLVGTVEDMQRLNELYAYEHTKKEYGIKEYEPFLMRKSGYNDTRMVTEITVGNRQFNAESHTLFHEQKAADAKSHRVYNFVRGRLERAQLANDTVLESPENINESELNNANSLFQEAMAAYNRLMMNLAPRNDPIAKTVIGKYCDLRAQEFGRGAKNITNSLAANLILSDDFNKLDSPIQELMIDAVRFEISSMSVIDSNTIKNITNPEHQKAVLDEVKNVMDDLHVLYHIGAARQVGGTQAALFTEAFERMKTKLHNSKLEKIHSDIPVYSIAPEITSLLPIIALSSELPDAYSFVNGHYTQEDLAKVQHMRTQEAELAEYCKERGAKVEALPTIYESSVIGR